MPVCVTIVDPFAALRRGVGASLGEAGFHLDEPADLLAWCVQEGERAVVLSLLVPSDFKCLESMRAARCDLPVVTLVGDSDLDSYRVALRAGSWAVLERGAEPEEIVVAVQAALTGKCLLPQAVAWGLSVWGPTAEESELLSPTEVHWIRMLARGVTVAKLASDVGYSEREMFRMLGELYRRMGVQNRSEALVQAARWGLLDRLDNGDDWTRSN